MSGGLSDYAMLDWVHFAIQEALNGNNHELGAALGFIEHLREATAEFKETQK